MNGEHEAKNSRPLVAPSSLHLTAEVMADNPLRELVRPGAKVIMKRLKRSLDVL